METYFGASDLEHFKKFFSLTIDHSTDPIVKAGGLQAMLACFLKGNKEVLKDFKQHIANKNGKAPVTNGKKKAKKAESSSDEEESSSSGEDEASSSSSSSEDEKPATKKIVGGKRKEKESSSSSSEGESSEDEKPPKKRKRTESISSRTRSNSDVKKAPKKAPEVPKGPIIPMKF